MRFWPLVLTLLLCATPASATVQYISDYTANGVPITDYGQQQGRDLVNSILLRTGVNYTRIPISQTTLARLKAGTALQHGVTVNYDVTVIDMFHLGNTGDFLGTRVDQLVLAANWPSVPTVFIGVPAALSGGWAQSSSCSLGTSGYTLPVSSRTPHAGMWMVGKDYVWHSPGLSIYGVPAPSPRTAHAGSIYRPIIGAGASAASPTASLTGNPLCNNCDSTSRSADPDSILLWVLYRSTAETAPLIFVNAASGPQDPLVIVMALAIADSASGGKVWETGSKIPLKVAAFIRNASNTGKWNTQSGDESTGGGGVFCRADSCDSANVKAAVRDSMRALGMPFTVCVDRDSVAAYPWLERWFVDNPNVHFASAQLGGATAGTGGAASITHPYDPMGHLRTRALMPQPATLGAAFPTTYSATDSSMAGMLYTTNQWGQQRYGGRWDHTLCPAYSDWSPVGLGAAGSSSLSVDSTLWVVRNAGFTGIMIGTDFSTGNVGRIWSASDGMALTNGTAPYGYWPDSGPFHVLNDPSRRTNAGWLGTINFVRARYEILANPQMGYWPGHDIKDEFLFGVFTGQWVQDKVKAYRHDFTSRPTAVGFNLQQFGGRGDNGIPAREGYWALKWMWNETRAIDALMIPGKHVVQWTWLENLYP